MSESTLRFTFNHEPKVIHILDVLVCFEGAGFSNCIKPVKEKLIGVVDIGGLNINGCIFNGFTPIRKSIFTIDQGIHFLCNDIQTEINSDVHQNMQDYEVPLAINDTRYHEQVTKVVSDYMRAVRLRMMKQNWNLQSLELVFIGGGSQLLENKIPLFFDKAYVSETGQKDNVIIFMRYLLTYIKGGR